MTASYLHAHPEFPELIRIVSENMGISPVLVEKDYWIMHCLYGLQVSGMNLQMKGGTSLSKGHKLIHRFSEDIDLLIEPPIYMGVAVGPNQDKPQHCQSRKTYYDWLSQNIVIDGIDEVKRDENFDDGKYRSGGIRLFYTKQYLQPKDLKEGILLEVGFDDVTPNQAKTISSWAYDFAQDKVRIKDNRAKGVLCYHPGYTFVEKLQTVSTKFRKQQELGEFSENFMRHYYDIFCLLREPEIQSFIATDAYHIHKKRRFRKGDLLDLTTNEAFLLSDKSTRQLYEDQYNLSVTLYYKDKPSFGDILELINSYIGKL